MISPDGVAQSRMVGVSISVIFPCTVKNKSLLTFNVWLHYFDCCSTFVQCLLVCVCVCVCDCVCVSVFLSVCYYCFFLIVVFTYSAH